MSEAAETTVKIELADEAATGALAAKAARHAVAGDVLALTGELGAGKTAFVRAFINARAETVQEVPSPTYTLVQEYEFPNEGETLPIFHFDLFRIEDAAETLELGMDDAFRDGVSLIEWPEIINGHLPPDRLDVHLEQGPAAGSRLATLTGRGAWAPRTTALAEKANR
ncbi:MAG: tRNA (adenosine(37)-N6)-threonylcarbamoyltransferase complex ATPase subunit type 1 TsaE [Rhodospirillales bacterium]|nr:tRNA (adenosine(37)-N6)-threonylcarbamoyltransferase complex ATPase subunit type 1 TsaE [Rhodospirillales bacterium]